METPNNTDGILTREEEIKFRELTNKILTLESSILTQEEEMKFRELTNKILTLESSPVETLSFSEKEEFLQLLEKLELVPQINKLKERGQLNTIVYLFSFIAIFAAFVGMPTLIVFYIIRSQLFAIFTVIGTTLLLILLSGALMGKVSWGSVIMMTGALVFTITLFLILSPIFT